MLGLEELDMMDAPTTLYILQYSEEGCEATCAFCPQSRYCKAGKELVSRIPWPRVKLSEVLEALSRRRGVFRRLCVQTVLKEGFEGELLRIVKLLREADPETPISVATTPVSRDVLGDLVEAGVERLGVGLDAASPEVFRKVGKPYSWETYLSFIGEALEVFGRGRVHIHLIFGMGESEEEFLDTMAKLYEMGAEVALFSFTPIPGTPMANRPPPPLERYRVVQVARYLLSRGYKVSEFAEVREGKIILRDEFLRAGVERAFLTSGCPGCNRPFYNERPSKIYNYPSLRTLRRELREVMRQLRLASQL